MFCFYAVITREPSKFIEYATRAWDNGWYGSIIEGGYADMPNGHDAGDAANWAFFPLAIVLVKLFSFAGALDYRYVAFFLNTFITVLAVTVTYKYVMLDAMRIKTAIVFALLVFFGPYGFYFCCMYTEALFMLLTVLFLYELRKENYILMGITGAFLSATRVTGVMMVFAVLLYIVQRHIKEKRGDIRRFVTDVLSDRKLIFGVCLVPLGLFVYMLYLRIHVGDSLAFLHIQKAWGRSGVNLYSFFVSLLKSQEYVYFHYFVTFLIIIAVFAYQVKKRPFETVSYVIPCAINFASLGFMNLARYSLGSGIAVIGFIDAIEEHLSRAARIFIYIILAITALRLQYWWIIGANITVG